MKRTPIKQRSQEVIAWSVRHTGTHIRGDAVTKEEEKITVRGKPEAVITPAFPQTNCTGEQNLGVVRVWVWGQTHEI